MARVMRVQRSVARRVGPVLVTLAIGCRDGQALRYGYVDNQGRPTQRFVEPLRVVHTGRRWYLVAFDRDRAAWRTFRVDRISEPVLTGSPPAGPCAPPVRPPTAT